MKKNILLFKGFLTTFVISLVMLSLLNSCSKSHSLSAPVQPSQEPANGLSSVGPAGPGNNLIYYGTNDPDPANGCLGDYYLDVQKGLLYGPKITGGWGNALALQGATAAENKVYSGNTDPSLTLGITGDYYVNTTSFTLFGPKAKNGWGNSIDLFHKIK